jgi:AcrR family transcriptional regulator
VETLEEAALPLFLERGIDGVTIDEIVAAAGVAKGSYYRYFDDKAALVGSILAPVRARVDEAFDVCAAALAATDDPYDPLDLTGAYQALAVALAGVVASSPGAIRLYLQEGRAPATPARAPVVELAHAVSRGALRLTVVAHERGLLRPMDARVSAAAVVGAAERLVFGALSGEDLGDPEVAVASLIAMVLDGLRAAPRHGA